MERLSLVSILLAIGLLGFAQTLLAEPQTAEQKLKNAMSTGPPSVAKDATILDRVDVAKAKVLRKGTNGWTCLPDDPGSPGNDPQCLDKNGWEWRCGQKERRISRGVFCPLQNVRKCGD